MAKKKLGKKRQLKKKELEAQEQKIQAQKNEDDVPVHEIRINVIGIGGGAGSIVSDIAEKRKRTHFYIADTDQSALSKFSRKRKIKTIYFGEDITQGMGTGMDVDLGQKAAEKDKEKIKEMIGGADLYVIVSCLGGGTGSGAAPIFAEICREMDSLVYGIFTLPFDFERERKLKTAKIALTQLRKHMHAMSVIPNQRVFKIVDEKVPIKKALSSINHSLGSSLEGLIEMVQSPGLINIDFADLETILRGESVLSYLSRVRCSGEDRIKQALGLLMDDPLYPYNFKEADNILFNIGAPNNLSLSEVEEISKTITEANEKESARIIFGIDIRQSKNDVDVTLLGVGCDMEEFFLEDKGDEPIKEKDDVRPKVKKKKKKKPAVVVEKPIVPVKSPASSIELPIELPIEPPIEPSDILIQQSEIFIEPSVENNQAEKKVRKNALQVQQDLEAIEEELLEKEKKWEAPSFLRKRRD